MIIKKTSRTTIPSSSLSLLLGIGGITTTGSTGCCRKPAARNDGRGVLWVYTVAGGEGRQRAPPGIDTIIHWENEDEGWVGGGSATGKAKEEDEGWKNPALWWWKNSKVWWWKRSTTAVVGRRKKMIRVLFLLWVNVGFYII